LDDTDRVSWWSWTLAGTVLGVPLVAYLLFSRFPEWNPVVGSGTPHFFIVSAVAGTALALALAVMWAARHLPDARTFFLAMGFLAMAGIFVAHGAATGPFFHRGQAGGHQHSAAPAPDPFVAYGGEYGGPPGGGMAVPATVSGSAAVAAARGRAVGLSARLSLLVSALCFALAMIDLRLRLAESIVRRWSLLAGASAALLCGYVVVALAAPMALHRLSVESERLSWAVAVVTWLALGFAGWRFLQAYRLAALPLQGTMALGMALLAEAQWFMLRAPLWHLSWWEYHVAMLAGFLAPVLGLLWQYRTSGDLGAVVEGLFLRDQVKGLRAGDPRALTALAAAVAAKDSETDAHTERVGELAVAIGRRVGLTDDRLELLRWAGRLHDLGKIGVPNAILRKPGRLTDAEFAVIKRHSKRGGRVVKRSRMLAEAAPFIRAHHERMNGTGYPDGLVGEAIPLEARVIAVADVWDALTCERPYRAAMPFDQAAAIIRRESGDLLDPRCVTALFESLEERAEAA
jgi:HD-GYP domain-containing protein (c-di-GMP phosphodiesterase class II)